MCFSLQRRAIFPHRNFKKYSETVSFLRFWLGNVLLATAACNFSTSQLQKVVRTCSERHILIENVLLATAACNFSTSQLQKVQWSEHVARGAFWLKMCFSLQRRAIFPHRNFKKWSETVSFLAFWLQNVLLATAACNFSCVLCRATSAPAALGYFSTQPTHKTLKNTAFRDFSNISRLLIFFLSAPVDLLSCSTAFSTVHIVGS